MDKNKYILNGEITLDGLKYFINPIKLNTNIPFCDLRNIIKKNDSDAIGYINVVFKDLISQMPTLWKVAMYENFSSIACITHTPHMNGYDFRFNPIEILNNIFRFINVNVEIPFINLDSKDGIKYLKDLTCSCISHISLLEKDEIKLKILDEVRTNLDSICDLYKVPMFEVIKDEIIPKDAIFYIAYKNLVMYVKTKDKKYLVYPKEYRIKVSNMMDTSFPHKIYFNGSTGKYWFKEFNQTYDRFVTPGEIINMDLLSLKEEDILVAFQIIPAGKLTLNEAILSRYNGLSKHSTKDEDKKLFDLKLKFYKESPYNNLLVGLYGLFGYVGFAYPNEYLICDKFYDKVSPTEVTYAHEEAIYALPVDRIDVLSKNKQQIKVEKSLDSRIKKFKHTTNGTFLDRLDKIIKSPRVSEKTLDEVLDEHNKILIKKY